MTRENKAEATVEDFAFDDDGITIADDPFAFDGDPFADDDPAADEWQDLPGSPSRIIAHDMLAAAVAEDPFSTSHLEDCLPAEGITPTPLSRYARASAAYLAACHSPCQDDEQQEILRRIAAYWLRRSRAFWLEE